MQNVFSDHNRINKEQKLENSQICENTCSHIQKCMKIKQLPIGQRKKTTNFGEDVKKMEPQTPLVDV